MKKVSIWDFSGVHVFLVVELCGEFAANTYVPNLVDQYLFLASLITVGIFYWSKIFFYEFNSTLIISLKKKYSTIYLPTNSPIDKLNFWKLCSIFDDATKLGKLPEDI